MGGDVSVSVTPVTGSPGVWRLDYTANGTVEVGALTVVEDALTGAGATATVQDIAESLFDLDAAYESLVALSPDLNGQSTNDDIAIALARQSDPAKYESLTIDRDVAAATDRLAQLSLDQTATDEQIAVAFISDATTTADEYADLQTKRQTLVDDATGFVDAWATLERLGIPEDATDDDIDSIFDNTAAVASANESKDILLDAGATDARKQVARTNLARLGLNVDETKTAAEIETYIDNALDRSTEITATKADLSTVQAASSTVRDAATTLADLGLSSTSNNESLAVAVVGIENVQAYYDDRDLLQEYLSGTIKGELESLEEIDTASVISGQGTTASPWLVEYTFATGVTAVDLDSPSTNVVLGAPALESGSTYRQEVYLTDTSSLSFGTEPAFTVNNASAATGIATAVKAIAAISNASITGGHGTAEHPWVLEYTNSSSLAASDILQSTATNVSLGDRSEVRASFAQEMKSLPAKQAWRSSSKTRRSRSKSTRSLPKQSPWRIRQRPSTLNGESLRPQRSERRRRRKSRPPMRPRNCVVS